MSSVDHSGRKMEPRSKFEVKNPGQRVGGFGLKGTQIIVNGPAPADAGWLNAGAELIIKGDSGDTTAHCAAGGKIYVSGRVGTRSGSLMKHDPAFPAPELWVMKNTGSFSFEFMGGGTAVICGIDCAEYPSILGDRSCMGMVGGTIYVRGPVHNLSDEVWLLELDEADREFLNNGLPIFLDKVDRSNDLETLTDFSQWKKIIAKTYEERRKWHSMRPTMHEFRLNKWVEDNGIFGGLVKDDYDYVAGLVTTGEGRLKIPHWKNKAFCAPCESACPSSIPTQDRINLLRQGKHKEAIELVLQYSPFPGSVCGEVCPNPCMDACTRQFIDLPVSMPELGNSHLKPDRPKQKPTREKKWPLSVAGRVDFPLLGTFVCRDTRQPYLKPTRMWAANYGRLSPAIDCRQIPSTAKSRGSDRWGLTSGPVHRSTNSCSSRSGVTLMQSLLLQGRIRRLSYRFPVMNA